MKKRLLALFILPFLLFCSFPITALGADEKEDSWEDEMVYFIMIDRFFNGNYDNDYEVDTDDPKAYHGGDLEGIIQKLDYIKELGYTAIWVTPIMKNEPKGYHGYWIEDFMEVEEHFGTMEDAKRLVKEAHDRDIKVLFDFVVNHTGYQHPWLEEPDKANWFHEEKRMIGDSPSVLENAWLAGLPDLNTENPEVKNYLFDAAEFWIEETGVDGFRLDTVKHVPKEFWQEFSAHVKSIDEDFFLIGEVWSNNPKYIAEYEETGIDSFVDYPLYEAMSQAFMEAGGDLQSVYNVWEANQVFYEQPYLLGTFLDNHDNLRFTREALKKRQEPTTRWKLALTYQFTAPGIPITYYGTEVPLDGAEDPDNRRMMNFNAGDGEVKKHIEQMTAIRNKFPVLVKGDFEELYNEDGMAVFSRSYEEEQIIVAINNSEATKSSVINLDAKEMQLTGLLQDEIVRDKDNGTYEITLDREEAEVFVVEQDKGLNWAFILLIVGTMGVFIAAVIWLSRKSKQTE
ncbi:alpha-amylase family glycosyl hydrolase [Thalassobacillus hwangdonensis]|uniref:Alpha-amylase n=1 Tax=Thalassobacillus hwangdonensis TaxID=546108 RepID=A0ABW3KWB9_9BACI